MRPPIPRWSWPKQESHGRWTQQQPLISSSETVGDHAWDTAELWSNCWGFDPQNWGVNHPKQLGHNSVPDMVGYNDSYHVYPRFDDVSIRTCLAVSIAFLASPSSRNPIHRNPNRILWGEAEVGSAGSTGTGTGYSMIRLNLWTQIRPNNYRWIWVEKIGIIM